MKKVHYLPLALLLGAGVAFAAPRRVITGTVVSQKDGRPLELATGDSATYPYQQAYQPSP